MSEIEKISEKLERAKLFNEAIQSEMDARGYATTGNPPVDSWDYAKDIGLLLSLFEKFNKFVWECEEFVDWEKETAE